MIKSFCETQEPRENKIIVPANSKIDFIRLAINSIDIR
jgi:hypothetical protein